MRKTRRRMARVVEKMNWERCECRGSGRDPPWGPSLRCITHLLSFFTISFLKRLSRWYGDDDDEHDIWASSLANLVESRLLTEYLSVTYQSISLLLELGKLLNSLWPGYKYPADDFSSVRCDLGCWGNPENCGLYTLKEFMMVMTTMMMYKLGDE